MSMTSHATDAVRMCTYELTQMATRPLPKHHAIDSFTSVDVILEYGSQSRGVWQTQGKKRPQEIKKESTRAKKPGENVIQRVWFTLLPAF